MRSNHRLVAACCHLRPAGPKLKLYGTYLCCCFLTRSLLVLYQTHLYIALDKSVC